MIGYDLDLSSLSNVKLFAEKIDRVDILLNNAGIIEKSFLVTADGIENIFGTNHSEYRIFFIPARSISFSLVYFSWTFLLKKISITSSH